MEQEGNSNYTSQLLQQTQAKEHEKVRVIQIKKLLSLSSKIPNDNHGVK